MLSSQELDAMGEQSFRQLEQSTPVDRDPQTNSYVRCVADAIVRQVPGNSGKWEVVTFEDESANAFALPGGKIGVYTGLLKVAQNEDQRAAVIGHEVGHVLAQHANERMSQQLAVQGGLGLLGAVAGGGANPALSQGAMQALGLGAELGILLPYGRVQESEADVIGLDLMARAGFDPRASVTLWHNMDRAGGGQPPEFLSTHPSHGTRIDNLQANMPRAEQTYRVALEHGERPECGGAQ